MNRPPTTWLALCLATMPLAAQADPLDPADCVQPGATMQQDLCLAAEYTRLDAELAHALDAAQATLLAVDTCPSSACAPAWEFLATAQRAWRDFRTADCQAAHAIAIDGSGRNSAHLDCLIEHTRIRIGQLQRLHLL